MKQIIRLDENQLNRLVKRCVKRIFERNNTSYDLNENFSVGDKVGTFPKSPSAVGYNGSFGTIKMIRPNNGKTMYYVQMHNSDNGAWFYEDEIVKEVL